jgi:hypothetical protein
MIEFGITSGLAAIRRRLHLGAVWMLFPKSKVPKWEVSPFRSYFSLGGMLLHFVG